ncbi:MAG: polyhydroxyalkanoate depolymerase, partial [Armatimonadetes bacterium CG_4_8_14_3_um_filter_66_20]
DACRACCLPARLVGVAAWTGKRGNHTWVEVWDNGWHFLGASESEKLDEGWFAADAAKANTHEPLNQLYASSWKRTAVHFPLVWDVGIDWVSAVAVTGRYVAAR